jgi:hypothetical protein
MRQTRLEEVVGLRPPAAAAAEQSQVRGSSLTGEQENTGERRRVEETVRGTEGEVVDEEEAGFRVIEARIVMQRAERVRKAEERE